MVGMFGEESGIDRTNERCPEEVKGEDVYQNGMAEIEQQQSAVSDLGNIESLTIQPLAHVCS